MVLGPQFHPQPIAAKSVGGSSIGSPRSNVVPREINKDLPWNTEARANGKHVVGNTEFLEEHLRIEPEPPSVKEYYRRSIETERGLGTLVDPSASKVYQQCRKELNWVLERAGFNPDEFELSIIRSPRENAFILHHEEINKPHVFITTGFLDKLEAHAGKLRAGHLRFVFGHEVAHCVLGHYEHESQKKQHEDPIPIRYRLGQSPVDFAARSLLSLAFTRDQELSADAQALRWCAEGGAKDTVNPREGIEVLQFIRSLEPAEAPSRDKRKRKKAAVWAAETILSSHPATPGRIARAKGALRQIEIESSVSGSAFAPQRRWKATSARSLAEDREIGLTQAQRMVAELNEALGKACRREDLPAFALSFVRERLEKLPIEQTEAALGEIKALTLLMPALLREHRRLLPFTPYGYLRELPPEKAGAGLIQGLARDDARVMEEIAASLSEAAEDVVDAAKQRLEAEGQLTEKAIAALELEGWLSSSALYDSEAPEFISDIIIPLLKDDPSEALEIIDADGLQFFDLRGLELAWLDRLVDSRDPAVSDSGVELAELVAREQADLRLRLFRILLEKEVLAGVKELPALTAFIEKSLSLLDGDDQETAQVAREYGHELSRWFGEHFDCANALGNAALGAALQEISLFCDKAGAAGRSVARALIGDVALTGNRGTFDERAAFLARSFSRGRLRDLLFCELLERETRLAEEKNTGDEFTVSHSDAYRPKNHVSYFQCFSRILPLLDCTWFEIALEKGEMVDWAERAKPPKSDYQSSDSASHSPLVHRFVTTPCLGLSGPRTREANVLRFYSRTFLEVGMRINPDPQRRLLEEVDVGSSFDDFYKSCAEGAFYRLITDLPLTFHFPSLQYDGDESAPGDPPLYMHLLEAAQRDQPGSFSLFERMQLLAPDLGESFRNRDRSGEERLLTKKFAHIPEGECRDYLVLAPLGLFLEIEGLVRAERILEESRTDKKQPPVEVVEAIDSQLRHVQDLLSNMRESRLYAADPETLGILAASFELKEIKAALALLTGADDRKTSLSLSSTASERVHEMEILGQLYKDFTLYLRYKAGQSEVISPSTEQRITFFNLHDVATEVGRLAFSLHYSGSEELAKFQSASPEVKFDEITSLFVYPSPERDAHLMRIVREAEKLQGRSNFYQSPLAEKIYRRLYSPYCKADVGERRYQETLAAAPGLRDDFDGHLALLLETHPPDSVRRERRLKAFFDGRQGEHACVRSWEERDKVQKALGRDEASSHSAVARKGGLQFLEAAINELEIPAKERVDTLLWIAKLREKSHLVRCYEALEGKMTSLCPAL